MNYSQHGRTARHRKRSRRSRIRQAVVIGTLVLGVAVILWPRNDIPDPGTKAAGKSPLTPIKTKDELTVSISRRLDKDDSLGLTAKDLKTGDTYDRRGNQSYDGASTVKVLIVAYMYKQAANNQFDLDDEITIPSSDVQRYGTGSIQYEKGPYVYSYRELAKRMMHESDNTAAFVLAKKLDKDKIQQFAEERGLHATSMEQNTTTPADMLRLMELLYRNQITEQTLNQELLGYMKNTTTEDRIPVNLPNDAVVYHKTGDAFDGGLHDVGVVEYRGHNYIVSMFSKGVEKETLADISSDVFRYMTR